MRRETLLDFFADLAEIPGPFLIHDTGFRSRSHSYGEVARAARAFAARLARAGLTHGDKVLFWSENRPEWIAALWGCLLQGIIAVPIDYRAAPDFVRRIHAIVGARVLLTGDEVEWAGDSGDGLEVWPLASLDWTDASSVPSAQVTRDDVAEIIFTSGATAEPKGVLITHRNLLANIVPVEREVLKYRRYARPFSPIRFLNLLPLSHMFGQAMAAFVPPMIGGTVVFIRGYNPAEITRQIKKRRVSVLVSVPKILDVLKEHVIRLVPEAASPEESRRHFLWRWWRYRRAHRLFGWKFWCFVVGAAPLDPALEQYWGRLGFLVVQGYGLTETAPIVSLNHPFRTSRGSVGKAIAGVEVKIAPDGEILVRGENVTSGYFGGDQEAAGAFDEEGWFHTGDIGEMDAEGRLYIRGRKKEMIVTPEGLNVFPEDVERALEQVEGVVEAAVVGVRHGSEERVHAVLVLRNGADASAVVREANSRLADHQKIRGVSVWPGDALPRTEGTRKLKRREIRDWVAAGTPAQVPGGGDHDSVAAILQRYAAGRAIGADTTIDELGLSSLERVELMVALEGRFQASIDEAAFSRVRSVSELEALVKRGNAAPVPPAEPLTFPSWNRSAPVRLIRRVSLATWILPIARIFAHIRVEGREHLDRLTGPVVFASNHQSHMDTPVILAAMPGRLRARVAVAMAKEFFHAHFFPEQHTRRERFTNSLNYYLAAFFFNAFPLPQREAGARQTLRYIGELLGDGFSVLIYPEGRRTEAGEISPFRPGIGMIGARLNVPIVPIRLEGVDKVLHQKARMATPGPVRVAFGPPMTLRGDDYEALARQVEEAVRRL
ncbi:MAG TPA: AMP-binding protein [Vicinamibacterales bacterium]|nr:AMP-binding protein [Vicinamibacterales bacterium]